MNDFRPLPTDHYAIQYANGHVTSWCSRPWADVVARHRVNGPRRVVRVRYDVCPWDPPRAADAVILADENGYWHGDPCPMLILKLGDIRRRYRMSFGETPETAMRQALKFVAENSHLIPGHRTA